MLELEGSPSAAVTATYSGLSPTGFQTVAFAPGTGGHATLAIGNDAALPGTIAGFIGFGDTIDLTALSDASGDATASFDPQADRLTVTGDNGSVSLQLDSEDYAGVNWGTASDGSGGTVVMPQQAVVTTAAPSIAGIQPNQGLAAGASDHPFAGVVIADASTGATDTVAVVLSDPSGGALSNPGDGSYDAATGTYTDSGTPASVGSDLDGLVFTPAAPASGVMATTGLAVGVTGPGGHASDSVAVTVVTQGLGPAATPPADAAISVSPDGIGFAAPMPDAVNQAVIADPAPDGTYTLPEGYQAVFLGGTVAATLSDPSGGDALLVGNTGNDTIVSGAAGDTILDGSGPATYEFTATATHGLLLDTAGGSAAIMDAGSHDTILGGSGAAAASLSGAAGTFLSATGSDSVTASGTGDTLVGGAGLATYQFTSTAGDVLALGGSGGARVADAGSGDTVVGGSGAVAASLSGAGGLFLSEAGLDSVVASGLNDTLFGGSLRSTYQFTSTAGDVVVFGGSGGLAVTDAGRNDTLAGGSGASVVSLSGAGGLFFAQQGTASVVAGGQQETMVGGSNPSAFRVHRQRQRRRGVRRHRERHHR